MPNDCAEVLNAGLISMSSSSKKYTRVTKFGPSPTAIAAKRAKDAERVILVADDNDDTRMAFATVLKAKGYKVVEAADGEEAINVTMHENPGLLLLDLELPRLDGLSVLRRL